MSHILPPRPDFLEITESLEVEPSCFCAPCRHVFSGPPYKDFPLFLTRRQQGFLRIPAEMTQRDYELLKQQIEHSLGIIEATSLADTANDRKEEE